MENTINVGVGDTVSFSYDCKYPRPYTCTLKGRVTASQDGKLRVTVRRERFSSAPSGAFTVEASKVTVLKKAGQTDPTQHSDKGLETLRQMGTKPEQWGLTPIKWEEKFIEVETLVACPVCQGEGEVGMVDGKVVQRSTAWNKMKSDTIKVCENCPQVRFTKAGRSYAWKAEGENFYRESDGHHGAAHSRLVNYSFMNGLVEAKVSVRRMVGTVLWAKGTRFDSRFEHNCGDCALCAKVIPSRRFVPVHGKDDKGQMHGMWVGEDCARKFFGVKAFKPEQVILRDKFNYGTGEVK